MTVPPLAAFLDDPECRHGEDDGTDPITATVDRLAGILSGIVTEQGVEGITTATNLDPAALEPLLHSGSDSGRSITLQTAAAILSTTTAYPASEVRARVRDHLILSMSRGPVDVATISEQYGLGDPVTVRAKIEGEEPFSLREYARLRVVIGWMVSNQKP